jgi:hypothetical protein
VAGSATDYLQPRLLSHTLAFGSYAAPTSAYVALTTSPPSSSTPGLEVAGGASAYVRQRATFALSGARADLAINIAAVEFPQAARSWGVIGYFELWDAVVGGNRLYWGALVDPSDNVTPLTLAVSAGDIVRFSVGTLGVQTGAGSTDTSSGAWLPLSGGQLTGPLYLAGDPIQPNQAATRGYVDAHSGSGGGAGFLPLSGGTMLGPLTLAANAAAPLQAASLQQLNAAVAGGPFLPLAGGAVTGNVSSVTTMAGDQLNLTKNYATTLTGSPHQTVNTANITVPMTRELWNNFDDVNYNVAGGTDASTGVNLVGRYTQIRKSTRSVNVPCMSIITSVVDFTNQPSSVAGPLVGYELDLECAGADDQTAFGPNGSRVGMTMNFYPARGYAGNDSVVNDAYAVYGDPSRVSFKRLFNASAAWSFAAIDLTQGVQLPSATSIAMNAGMRIRFAPLRDIYWDTTLFSGAGGFNVTGKMEVDELLYAPGSFTASGTISLAGNATIGTTGGNLGFYGTLAIAKQTGVAVTAAGIHAALTALGLIAP